MTRRGWQAPLFSRLVVGWDVRVLGIDPGSHLMGWGIIEALGSQVSHIDSGALRAERQPLVQRLCSLADGLETILRAHGPDAVAVETVFCGKDSQSLVKLAQARGVALLCAGRCGVPVFEYTAGQIKKATTGRGQATKEQVQHLVCMLLRISVTMLLDTSDALAVALCHCQFAHGAGRVAMAPECGRAGSKQAVRQGASVGLSWSKRQG